MKQKIACFLAALVFAPVFCSAQTTPVEDDAPIKVSTVLLNVPVIVRDRAGKNVAGLRAEDFKVTSGGSVQTIEYFSDAEMPLTVGIVLDVTGSVTGVLGGIKTAAKEFVQQLGPADQCMVVTFGEKTVVEQAFTGDKKRLEKTINSIQGITGGTAIMNTALLQVLQREFASVQGRKAIILITDAGEINNATTASLMDELIEGDTVVYPIYYATPSPWLPRKGATLAELVKNTPVGNLDGIARATGGRLLAATGGEFGPEFQTITDELKKMYVIGFYPDVESEGKQKAVDITMNRPGLFLRTKRTIRLKSKPKQGTVSK